MSDHSVYNMLKKSNKLAPHYDECWKSSRIGSIMGTPQTSENVGPGQYNLRLYDGWDYQTRRRINGVDMRRQSRFRLFDRLVEDHKEYAGISAQTYTPEREIFSKKRITHKINTSDRDTTLFKGSLSTLSPNTYFRGGVTRQDTRIPAKLYREDRFHRRRYQVQMDDLGPGSHDPKITFISKRR